MTHWLSVTKFLNKGDKVLDEWLKNCADPAPVEVPSVGGQK